MDEYIVPVFYAVWAHSPTEARDAIICTLEQHEYDQGPEEVGTITTVCVGNEDEITKGD